MLANIVETMASYTLAVVIAPIITHVSKNIIVNMVRKVTIRIIILVVGVLSLIKAGGDEKSIIDWFSHLM